MPEYHGTATLPDGRTEEKDGTLQECLEWADEFQWIKGGVKISIKRTEEQK